MKHWRTLWLPCVAAITLGTAVKAQEPPEARLAECYRSCYVGALPTLLETWYLDGDAHDEEFRMCMTLQELAFGLVACNTGCKDIAEHTFGERDEGRTLKLGSRLHLNRLIARIIAPLREAGLWRGSLYDTPTIEAEKRSEWLAGCDALTRRLRQIRGGVRESMWP